MENTKDAVLEMLTKARELVSANWGQADERGELPRGSNCMCTAMQADDQHMNVYLCAYETICRVIDPAWRESSTPVVSFNDALGRTQDEVVDAFTRAIALRESEL